LAYWLSTRNGGSDSTGAESLALFGANPTLARVSIEAVLLGGLLIVPAVIGVLRLVPRSRLAAVGGWLMIFGYICYFGVLLSNVTILTMAERGGPTAEFAAVIDASQSQLFAAWVFLLFVVGNLIGTLIFAIGLLRNRVAGIWPAILIMCWPPLHVVGLVVGNELFEVAGAVLQAIGFGVLAVSMLRGGRTD
ncbi:MAG TPA: hypothetical protein VIB48_21035, partial [Acidimicrobiia bacterium]